jgi:hypothetical protein
MSNKTTACDARFGRQSCSLVATVELPGSGEVRSARVADIGFHGCYLSMTDSFPEGASLLVKIRTGTAFFQSHATVMRSATGIGMGVVFRDVSPPFQIVLQDWLSAETL